MKAVKKIKHSSRDVPAVVALTVLFCFLFRDGFRAFWQQGESWHLFIPLIASYVFWRIFTSRNTVSIFPAPLPGTLLLVCGIVFVLAGAWSATSVLSELGTIAGIYGLVLALFGYHFFAVFLFPLLYLVFMTSLTDGALGLLSPVFRQFSAAVSVGLASMAGLDILQHGSFVRLPHMMLNVADECSGVNHVLSLIATSLPLAYLGLAHNWKRAILVSASVPVALVSNGIRVYTIILFNYNRTVFTHGPGNIFVTGAGFFIGLGLMTILLFLLREKTGLRPAGTFSQTRIISRGNHLLDFRTTLILLAVLSSGLLFGSLRRPQSVQLGAGPDSVPTTQNAWSGGNSLPVSLLDDTPSPDALVSRSYEKKPGQHVHLYIAYFAKQTQGREIAGHSFSRLRRMGFERRIETSRSGTIPVHFSILEDARGNPHAVAQWYFTNRYHTTSELKSKLFSIIDAFSSGNTAGSLIVCSTPIRSRSQDGQNRVEFDTLSEFITEFYSDIRRSVTRS